MNRPLTVPEFDGEYLRRLREGDPATNQQFAMHFGRLLHLKLRSRVRSFDMLEDVRQETFARTLAAIRKGSIQQPERLGAYISSVADRVLFEYIRDRGRMEENGPNDFIDGRLDLDRELVDAERARHVRTVMAELPEKERDALRMIFLEGLDRSEVCSVLGVRPDYLRVVVHRACGKLRERLSGKKYKKV
ncbi:MAG TPA: RNA polymerase sigma factor [Bryobacteraceae bacterium]|nr:RNA polymerase sigma factor [Bryobacteraceae bacterium]